MQKADEIIKNLEKKLSSFDEKMEVKNVGTVVKNTDGVITATGLSKAVMGEQVEFENGSSGIILNLDEDSVSIILLNNADSISEGNSVKTTGKLLSINVSEDILGRVVNPLGEPLDGKAKIKKGKDMPLEKIAPGVVEREPVNTPLKTGLRQLTL